VYSNNTRIDEDLEGSIQNVVFFFEFNQQNFCVHWTTSLLHVCPPESEDTNTVIFLQNIYQQNRVKKSW